MEIGYVLVTKLLGDKAKLTQAAWSVFTYENHNQDYQALPLLGDCLRAADEETSGIKAL